MRCQENHQIHFLCKIALFENSQPPITMETTKILQWITMWDFFLLGWLCVINFCYIIFFLDSPEKAAVILAVSLTSPHLSSVWKEEAWEGDQVPALALLQAVISCLTLKNVLFLGRGILMHGGCSRAGRVGERAQEWFRVLPSRKILWFCT